MTIIWQDGRRQGRIDNALVYDALAEAESDPRVARILKRLAAVERAHGEIHAQRPGWRGGTHAAAEPSLKARGLAWIGQRLGPEAVLPVLAREDADLDPDGEAARARLVQRMAAKEGGLPGQTLAQLEGRHRSGGGNALRAAVLGANDGLVSNLSLVMGVSGAAAGGRTVLLTGLAGLVAGACSMAMGEWLSVNSSREMSQKQIDQESVELERSPELEKQELVLIYQSKGLDEAAARTLADKLFQSRDAALDALAREELGVDPEGLGGSAWAAAAASFCLFSAGAIFPVAPFIFTQGLPAVAASLVLSGLALAGIGAATSRFTGRGLLYSAGRTLMIGYAAAAITFAIGRLLGASVTG
jgi:VIT1/CCC1 family predicted Fe2+/Mn2+ transporter